MREPAGRPDAADGVKWMRGNRVPAALRRAPSPPAAGSSDIRSSAARARCTTSPPPAGPARAVWPGWCTCSSWPPPGDASVAVSLAGTLFFTLPTEQARPQVAQFLLLTMAPFAIVAPFIGPFLDRFRHGRRWAIGVTLALRGFLCWVLADALDNSLWLFPAALGCLVASKAFTVTQASAVPRLLPDGFTLVNANSRISMAKVGGAAVGGGLAVGHRPGSGRSGHCGSASPSSSPRLCWPSCCRPRSTRRRASATSADCSRRRPGRASSRREDRRPAPVPQPEAERAARAALRDGRSADDRVPDLVPGLPAPRTADQQPGQHGAARHRRSPPPGSATVWARWPATC